MSIRSSEAELWRISRLWSVAAGFDLEPFADERYHAIVSVEGTACITTSSASVDLPPRHIVVTRADTRVTTESSEPWARLHWSVVSSLLGQRRFTAALDRPIVVSDSYWALLMAMTNAIAIQGDLEDDLGSPQVADALGSVLAAVLSEAAGRPQAGDRLPRSDLYAAALRVIDEQHRDPAFNVSRLASAVGASLAQLHRAFAGEKTTPGQMVEQRRAATVRSLRLANPSRSRRTAEEIARLSGFTTVKRMQNALRRQGG